MLVFNSAVYIGAVVVLSGAYGIIGLTYANCLNMGVRSIMSLKFSLDQYNLSHPERTSVGLISLFSRILSSKYFIGLVCLGGLASVAAKFVLEYILYNVLQKNI